MSTANVVLYKNTNIVPERNMRIESLSLYLLPKTFKTLKSFQYQRTNLLEFSIKVDLSQDYINSDSVFQIDYCEISNKMDDLNPSRPFYYFVVDKIWKGEKTLELKLVLDTINTFNIQTDYHISNRTQVIREHRDRFGVVVSPWETLMDGYFMADDGSQDVNHYHFYIQGTANPFVNVPDGYSIEIHIDELVDEDNIDQLDAGHVENLTFFYSFEDMYGNPDTKGYLNMEVEFDYNIVGEHAIVKALLTIEMRKIGLTRRKIDLTPEGLSPILYKTELGTIKQPIDTSWNLIYRTAKVLSEEDNNAVECTLMPDDELFQEVKTQDCLIGVNDLTAGDYSLIAYKPEQATLLGGFIKDLTGIGIPATISWPCTFDCQNGTKFDIKCEITAFQGEFSIAQYCCYFYRSGGDIVVKYLRLYGLYRTGTGALLNSSCTELDSQTINEIKVTSDTPFSMIFYYTQTGAMTLTYTWLKSHVESNDSYYFTGVTNTRVKPLADLDRTDSKLIKIIKIPYTPSEYGYNNQVIAMEKDWELVNGIFTLKDNNVKFKNTFTTDIDNPIRLALNMQGELPSQSAMPHTARNKKYESKLYHSDYYQIKCVYDAFSYVFPLEKMDVDNMLLTEKFTLTFIMTSTINSKFAFIFNDILYNHATEDYDNVMPIGRNNEVVIYNSTYLNYLRTAYNYDLKAKERTITSSSVGLGASIVGSIVGIALGVASYNPAIIVSSVVAGTSAITTGVVNQVNTIAQAEASMESKRAQLQNQAVSVGGSDDVDIMTAYSGNRAKLCLYKVSERLENALFNLFYLTGYLTNENKIPSFTSRYWFNYIAMNIDIDQNIASIPKVLLDDLKARWSNGVTIFHRNVIGGTNEWDLQQQYENWEVGLLS